MSMDTNAPWRDEELLRQKYVHEQQQPKEIIEELGCSRTAFYDWVNKFGLKEEREAKIDRPWRDKNVLRELYVEQEMTLFEVADELGCSGSAVQTNLEKVGIGTRDLGGTDPDAEWKQEDTLRRLYHEEGLTTREVARKYDIDQKTVLNWMDKHDIDRRKSNYELPPLFFTQKNGYERVESGHETVFVHQLVAIANGDDPYKVLGDLTHVVHHEIPIPWLNTPDNVGVITQSEHRQIHGNQYTD